MRNKFNYLKGMTAAIVLALLTGSLVQAQPGGGPGGGGQGGQGGPPPLPSKSQIKKIVKELDKELDLSDEQSEQVSEIYFAHFDEVEELQSGSSRPDRTKMEALDSKLQKNVKAELDEDQQKLYSAWLKEQEKERSSQRPGGGGRPPR